jgi:SAM-dependent methyltransferase
VTRPQVPGACPACGEPRLEALFDSPDYLSGERFAVVCCPRCGICWTVFPHPESSIGHYYGDSYYGRAGRRFGALAETLVGLFRRGRVRAILHASLGPGRVLDVGCGRGLILRDLRRRGWESYGTELSPALVESLKADAVQAWEGSLRDWGLPEGSFDVAIMWHSLEHQFDPVQMLEAVGRALKPGGLLLLEVPNRGSLQSWLGGRTWFHLDVPRHLVHFSRRPLAEMLERSGLRIERLSTWSLEQGPFGMTQSLLNRVTRHPNVLYGLIKRVPGERRASVWDLALTVLLSMPLAAVGSGLEAVAALLGYGGVLRVTARKGPGT